MVLKWYCCLCCCLYPRHLRSANVNFKIIYCIGVRGFHAFERLRMWPTVRTKTAQLCNSKRCGLQLYTWGLRFSSAGLGAVESSSIPVPIKPPGDRGQARAPFVYMCHRMQSIVCLFLIVYMHTSYLIIIYTVYT